MRKIEQQSSDLEKKDIPFVRIRNLSKEFGSFTAVSDFSADVYKGETLALLGPSGCGKTTILRCIAGLERPTAGSVDIGSAVVFDGSKRINVTPEHRGLGVVFQSYAIWPHMTVAENVAFPLKVRGTPKAQIAKDVSEILRLVGLGSSGDQSATDLSGGQQQRVALARALVHRPQLVLFDEPMSNLDAKLREQMRVELKLLQDRLRFTAIYVTHDQSEAFALANKIIVMNKGQVEAAGATRDIFWEPPTEFVAKYFGLNVLRGRVVGVATDQELARSLAQVEFADQFRLWGHVAPGCSIVLDAEAAFCVRKEHLHLTPALATADTRVDDSGKNQSFEAEIRTSAFQGLNDEYVVAAKGVEFRTLHQSIGIGSSASRVFLDRKDCIVLPISSA